MDLGDRLRRASAAHRSAMERALAPSGLTPPQHAVLLIALERPGVSSAEAARLERLTPPTLSVIVANLCKKGLITRKAQAGNLRVQGLEVTQAGRELVQSLRENARNVEEALIAAADQRAAESVRDWLDRVAALEA